jgi:hypothetical protein
MRRVAGWLGLLWLVAGCTVPGELPGMCQSNADCGTGALCDVEAGLCYAAGPEGGACSPACAEYQACTAAGCRPRFTALNLLSPSDESLVSGGSAVEVVAELVADPAYANTTQLPATLSFSASRSDNGETGSFGAVVRDGNQYKVQWTPPGGQAQVTLRVAHPVPAAGLSGAVRVTVESEPPVFTLSLSSPRSRSTGGAAQADERDPAQGYDTAFRRDESVTVTVTADEPVREVKLFVTGIGPGGSAGAELPGMALQPRSGCAGAPAYCGGASVDLSLPEMRSFRGTMGLRVEGLDEAGNRGVASSSVKVTRWSWAYEAGGKIAAAPAVGNRGDLYFGTYLFTGAGKFFALTPSGAAKWSLPLGDVMTSPAVGALNQGDEYIYVSSKTGNNVFLNALRIDGTLKSRCAFAAGAYDFEGALAVSRTTVSLGTVETGLGIYNGNQVHIAGVRPDAPSSEQCYDVTGFNQGAIPRALQGGSLVCKDQNIFFAYDGAGLTSYDLDAGSSVPRAGWPQSTHSLARSLTVVGDRVYGGAGNTDDPSLGSLFSVPVSGGPVSFVYPSANTSRVFSLAVGPGGVAYFGAETAGGSELLGLSLDVPGAAPTRASNVGTLWAPPVVGRNGLLYTLNTEGRLAAWAATASTLAQQWNVDLPLPSGTVNLSPTLDCRRDTGGAPIQSSVGSFYAVVDSKVYAFIVDSPGLEPTAAWPKYQHDPRNTGNPATLITRCP